MAVQDIAQWRNERETPIVLIDLTGWKRAKHVRGDLDAAHNTVLFSVDGVTENVAYPRGKGHGYSYMMLM